MRPSRYRERERGEGRRIKGSELRIKIELGGGKGRGGKREVGGRCKDKRGEGQEGTYEGRDVGGTSQEG